MSEWKTASWHGMETIMVTGDVLEATFLPDFGGQVLSLRHRASGFELLRVPKDLEELKGRPFLFGIPVLFLPGRLRGGEFDLGGRHYQWPRNERGLNHLHGFVWGRPWTLEPDPAADGSVVASFTADIDSEEAKAFGHPFSLRLRYHLHGEELSIRARIDNLDRTEAMPLGFGYHTTFNFLDPEGGRLQYVARMPSGQEWVMGDDVMPVGPLTAPEKFQGWVGEGQPVWDVVSDNLFLVDEGAENRITLSLERPALTLWMQADAPFRNWVVYRPDLEAPFMAIEPVSWVHNAPNLDQDADRTGVRLLAPGSFAEFNYRIGLHQ